MALWLQPMPVQRDEQPRDVVRAQVGDRDYIGRHVTLSIESTIISAIETPKVSPPRAASSGHEATWRHIAFSRQGAGRCRSISTRTSASVVSVTTRRMFCGRGRGRDHFDGKAEYFGSNGFPAGSQS